MTKIAACLVLVATLLPALPAPVGAAGSFAAPAFREAWEAGERGVPNYWGPLGTAFEGQREPYDGGQRTVQYFDKGRMELHPDGKVRSGLLVVEMKARRVQVGGDRFEARSPARVNVAGDLGGDGPTYADLATLPERRPNPGGGGVLPFRWRDGLFSPLSMGDGGGSEEYAPFVPQGKQVTYIGDPSGRYGDFVFQPFADFIARAPGGLTTVGYPLGPFWIAEVRVAGQPTRVIAQAFERRVLTMRAGGAVEFGNIGRHYRQWRYGDGGAASVPTAPPSTATPAASPATATTALPTAAMARGAVAPANGRCPANAPVKGNTTTNTGERIYHVPGGAYYARTIPEACFATARDAEAAGFRASQR